MYIGCIVAIVVYFKLIHQQIIPIKNYNLSITQIYASNFTCEYLMHNYEIFFANYFVKEKGYTNMDSQLSIKLLT